MTDNNNELIQITFLPGMEEISISTPAEITELRKILEKYNELLGRIIRSRVSN